MLSERLPVTHQAMSKHRVALDRVVLVLATSAGGERQYQANERQLAQAAAQLAGGSAWDTRLQRTKKISAAIPRAQSTSQEHGRDEAG
jgi:GAF domain-containing protein